MNDTPEASIEELQRRSRSAMALSAEAAARNPEAFRQLRHLAAAVADGTVDIGAYHRRAAEMVQLLETLCTVGAGTVFVYFRRGLDPNCEGNVRTFRPLCRDLSTVLDDLEQRRRARSGLRRIK